jgi:hypothetical protein
MTYIPEGKKLIQNITGATTLVVPANMYILGIVVESINSNPIIGGIKIGTTIGGNDVVNGFPILGSTLTHVTDSSISKKIFSKTLETTLYIDAVTLFNNASVNVSLLLRESF